jgi:hypothetical protein
VAAAVVGLIRESEPGTLDLGLYHWDHLVPPPLRAPQFDAPQQERVTNRTTFPQDCHLEYSSPFRLNHPDRLANPFFRVTG